MTRHVTPPTGRISRKVFWIAIVESVLCIAVAVALYGAILGSLGLTLDSEMWSGGLAVLMLSGWTWSTAAVGGKRPHDRNRPAGWIAIPIAWQVLTSLQVAANSNEDVKAVVGLVGLAIGLWVLIDLGLLKGTPGPNRYGPDPLAAKVQAAS
jgi:uncharacterized membrane protein YhaH (DUF805 family)